MSNFEILKKELPVLAVCLLLLFVGFVWETIYIPSGKERVSTTVGEPLDNLPVVAKGYYVYDILAGKRIAGKLEDSLFPIASITKLMTAIVSLEQTNGKTTKVSIQAGELPLPKERGRTTWNLREILKLTLAHSSNEGAKAVAAAVMSERNKLNNHENKNETFVDLMNQKANSLTLSSLSFQNESGLDEGGVAGALGSPKDVALLFAYAWAHFPETIEATSRNELIVSPIGGPAYIIKNTNQTIDFYPGSIGSKTGTTELANGTLVSGFEIEPGWPVVIAILGSTKEERFKDMETLYLKVRGSLTNKDL